MAYLHESSGGLGRFGWNCEYRIFGNAIAPAGHEVITRDAIGGGTITYTVAGTVRGVSLSATDVAQIILGNRSVDLGLDDSDDSGAGITNILTPSEQRRHALRATFNQPLSDAVRDILAEFGRQHAAILGESDPNRRMRRIGVILHLIQDSFSTAHTDRDAGALWCIRRIRNYGRGSMPAEHGTPSDERDSVTLPANAAARAQATVATRRYLAIVFKAIDGVLRPDPIAASEALFEVGRFAADVFRTC